MSQIYEKVEISDPGGKVRALANLTDFLTTQNYTKEIVIIWLSVSNRFYQLRQNQK